MKTKNKLALVILGGIALSSCSNHPLPPKTTIVDTRVVKTDNGSNVTILTQNAINGDVVEDTDNSLNVVSRADNVKIVGLKTLQFAAMLLVGGSGSVNGYSKEQLKRTHIASVKNKTMEYLNPEIDTILNGIDIPANKKIIVQPYKVKLIYDGLDNNNYEFIYSITISVGDFYHICTSNKLISIERIQPIDVLERNNYELTQVMVKKVIKICFEDINSVENKVKLANTLLSSSRKNNPQDEPAAITVRFTLGRGVPPLPSKIAYRPFLDTF